VAPPARPLAQPSRPAKASAATPKVQHAPTAKARPASLPHGLFLTGALVPTVRKLPFLAVGLVALAILLLSLGVLPATAVPHPAAAELLAERRRELALGGLLTLLAAIAAYLLV
jgi:hypothetical protein